MLHEGEYKPNRFTPVVAAMELSEYVFLITDNANKFPEYITTEKATESGKQIVAGTIDFVDYQDGKYTIYDWKRSDKIIANGMPVKVSKYQENGLYPLEHLDNCAYYHYALRLLVKDNICQLISVSFPVQPCIFHYEFIFNLIIYTHMKYTIWWSF